MSSKSPSHKQLKRGFSSEAPIRLFCIGPRPAIAMPYQIIFQSKPLYDCNNKFCWNFIEPVTVIYTMA